jgi:apolipoprotein N-acyltransferase
VTLLVAVLGVQLLTLKTWRWVRLISILGLFGIGDILAHVQWTAVDHHHPIPVTLVQGNIAQSLKWEPNMLEHSILTYQELSQAAFSQKNQLIIWPESAIPDTVQDLPTYLAYLNAHLQARHDGLILGILESQGSDQNPAYYNAALGLGRASGVYLKEHLVPFGEYIPFQAELGRVFAWMNIPMSGFSEGPANQAPIRVGGLPVGVFICYEVGYPSLVRQQSRGKAFLVVLSDDAWFGDSLGPWQQAQMAQMRALETGRYVVNSTNNGVTSVIDPEGRVIASIPRGAALTLTSTIYPVSGETPWQRWGV